VSLLHGDEMSGLGWFAPVYGTLLPTWTARVSRAAAAPFAMTTWIASAADAPSLTRLPTDSDPGGTPAIAIEVQQGPVTWVTMLRPGEPELRESRGCGIGAYHTDGRLLHYGSIDGRLVSLAACDTNHVLALREGWLSVASDAPMKDLYLEMVAGRIDAWSSLPTSRMRLQGALVAAAAGIRVNGRDIPPGARERADSAIITASSWGEPGRILPCVASPVSRI
jgi:hypothetical protein